MNCKRIQKILAAYMDGEITEKKAELFELHLNDCTSCAYELQTLQRTKNLIKSVTYEKPNAGFWQVYWTDLSSKLSQVTIRRPLVIEFFNQLINKPFQTVVASSFIIWLSLLHAAIFLGIGNQIFQSLLFSLANLFARHHLLIM